MVKNKEVKTLKTAINKVRKENGEEEELPQPTPPKNTRADFLKCISDFVEVNPEYENAEIIRRILQYEGTEHSPEVRSHLIADFEVLRREVIGEDSDEVFVEIVGEYAVQNNCIIANLADNVVKNIINVGIDKEETIKILDKHISELREHIVNKINEWENEELEVPLEPQPEQATATTQTEHADESQELPPSQPEKPEKALRGKKASAEPTTEVSKLNTDEEAILLALFENVKRYYSTDEIAQKIGLDSENVLRYLKQLEATNHVDDINFEFWRITEKGIKGSVATKPGQEPYDEQDEFDAIRILYHKENMPVAKIAESISRDESGILKVLRILKSKNVVTETDNLWNLGSALYDTISGCTRQFFKNTELMINMFQNPMTVEEIAKLIQMPKNKKPSKSKIAEAVRKSDKVTLRLLQILEDEGNVANVGEKWRLTDKAMKDEKLNLTIMSIES